MVLTTVAIAGLLVGFFAGLLTFKRSEHWCATCGETKRCPKCISLPVRGPML